MIPALRFRVRLEPVEELCFEGTATTATAATTAVAATDDDAADDDYYYLWMLGPPSIRKIQKFTSLYAHKQTKAHNNTHATQTCYTGRSYYSMLQLYVPVYACAVTCTVVCANIRSCVVKPKRHLMIRGGEAKRLC